MPLRRGRIVTAARELWDFGCRQALSCLFPVVIFASIAWTRVVEVPGIPAYDLLLLICLAAQAVMLRTGLESRDELKVICLFHLIGLVLELYKVHHGSWVYPGEGYTKLFGVPLYSGFMYASVASYLCQAWRRLDVGLVNWPRPVWTVPLGAAIYLNFMTHHYIWDLRWLLMGLLVPVFWKTTVEYRVLGRLRRMPVVLSFGLIGFFIWIAENLGTLLGAWRYPNQRDAWQWVGLGKFSSWFLLVIVSFIIVAQLKHVKAALAKGQSPYGAASRAEAESKHTG